MVVLVMKMMMMCFVRNRVTLGGLLFGFYVYVYGYVCVCVFDGIFFLPFNLPSLKHNMQFATHTF
jgi:hypothetical protein